MGGPWLERFQFSRSKMVTVALVSFNTRALPPWVTFSGSNEVRMIKLDLYVPQVSPPLAIAGLNNPRGIDIQP